MQFLLTRPSRDVTAKMVDQALGLVISTHTPLAGRDIIPETIMSEFINFYSHAPRGT